MRSLIDFVRRSVYPRLDVRSACLGSNVGMGLVLGAVAVVGALISHLSSFS